MGSFTTKIVYVRDRFRKPLPQILNIANGMLYKIVMPHVWLDIKGKELSDTLKEIWAKEESVTKRFFQLIPIFLWIILDIFLILRNDHT